jgi:hypothetical protein
MVMSECRGSTPELSRKNKVATNTKKSKMNVNTDEPNCRQIMRHAGICQLELAIKDHCRQAISHPTTGHPFGMLKAVHT